MAAFLWSLFAIICILALMGFVIEHFAGFAAAFFALAVFGMVLRARDRARSHRPQG